jgi:hypothetical protein
MMHRSPELAGVRVSRSGPVVIVETGGRTLFAGDWITVQIPGNDEDVEAVVAIAPDQLIYSGGARPAGRITGTGKRHG